MAIRWRLTLWFTLILLVILAFSGSVFYFLLQRYLFDGVDNSLLLYSDKVHGNLQDGSLPANPDYSMIHSSLPPVNEFASPGTYIQLIDSSGAVVVKSDNLGSQELPVSPALVQKALNGSTEIRSVAAGGSINVRIMVSPLHMPDRVLVLEVAQSLKTIEDTLRNFRVALGIEVAISLLMTALLGAMLVRRTLKPVENVTLTARQIAQGAELNKRVDYRGPPDEIGQLAHTFDEMIERLDKVFASQKQFVADASHELRTPLTIIQGNLDLLKRNLDENGRKESLKAIENESLRLNRIASDLLLLAELEEGENLKKELVPLRALVLDEIKRSQLLAGNRRVVSGELQDLTVRGDRHRLALALGNLVDNAIKYTPEGGQITLSLRLDESWARLDVSDSGVGIPTEALPYVFDRFYRVDKSRSGAKRGSGLGLAIVKGIVEKHGGKVSVSSEPGQGSTFSLWLKL